jgi:hypothetical protein
MAANGAPPLSYQWTFHGTNLPGATHATLIIPDIQSANCGPYTLVVTNSLGRATSSVALVHLPLILTNPPASQVIAVGGSVTFSAGASGDDPLAYQWQLNGTNLSGATSTSLAITNARLSDAGAYTVVVTDAIGWAITSPVAALTVGTLGTGVGLQGDYYSSQLMTFAGSPTLSRTDPALNFDWGAGSPDPLISTNRFTVRWSGQVQPFYSQTYTFYTTSDDGVRLWVNGQKLIDHWVNQGVAEWSGTIALNAYEKYDLLMEYYENTNNAVAQLSWSSPGQAKQVIPPSQLYPAAAPVRPALAASGVSNGTNLVLHWAGSYTLQSATNVTGPYLDLTGSTSPCTNNIHANPCQFFRLKSE